MESIAAETIGKVYTAFLLDEKCRILPMTHDDLELNYLMVAIGIPKMINWFLSSFRTMTTNDYECYGHPRLFRV